LLRSGWSKQGGFEIYVDHDEIGLCSLYDQLLKEGKDLEARPGCPNLIERIESGLLSYGNDMDMNDTPLRVWT
jgi:dimethylsulfoniopropionate demethylase